MQRLSRTVCLWLLCVFGLAATPAPQVFVFQVEGVRSALKAQQCADVMRARLRGIDVRSTAAISSPGVVKLTVFSSRAGLAAFIAAPGRISFKIKPSGPVYQGNTRIAKAFEADFSGSPAVMVTLVSSIRTFTTTNLNKYMGIFVDGKELTSARIVTPIDRDLVIVGGKLDAKNATRIAAILNAGPLPTMVRLVEH